MEKVFLMQEQSAVKGVTRQTSVQSSGQGVVVEKVIEPGKYVVLLSNGKRLTVLGPETLQKGTRVQIAPLADREVAPIREEVSGGPSPKGESWSMKFPFQLESGTSEVKLELYVEGDKSNLFDKKDPAVHLVFSIKTASLGQVQWSVYLRRNQVLAKVYFEKGDQDSQEIGRVIKEFEGSLKKKGFSLLAPTVILKRPFKASARLQLNIQG